MEKSREMSARKIPVEPYSSGGKFWYSNLKRENLFLLYSYTGILKFEFNLKIGGGSSRVGSV